MTPGNSASNNDSPFISWELLLKLLLHSLFIEWSFIFSNFSFKFRLCSDFVVAGLCHITWRLFKVCSIRWKKMWSQNPTSFCASSWCSCTFHCQIWVLFIFICHWWIDGNIRSSSINNGTLHSLFFSLYNASIIFARFFVFFLLKYICLRTVLLSIEWYECQTSVAMFTVDIFRPTDDKQPSSMNF